MKPLLRTVAAVCLVFAATAQPENIEDVKELSQSKDTVLEAEESEPQARVERCTTCTNTNLKLKLTPNDILGALRTLPPGQVHTEQSFEGCSTEKGCHGVKVKDGRIVEKYGNADSYNAAAAANIGNEYTFHVAGPAGDNPFWWMNENSPFKQSANYEQYKTSSSSFTSTGSGAGATGSGSFGGSLDLSGNPFLSGGVSKVGNGFTSSGQGSSFSGSSKGELDISNNIFLNGAYQNQGGLGQGAGQSSFTSGGSGYVGSSPRPFTASTGSNVNFIQNSQKNNDYDYEQSQQNFDVDFQSCVAQGFVCVLKNQCINGIVSVNGAGTKKQSCNTRNEVCCRIDASLQGDQNSFGSSASGFASSFGSKGSSSSQGSFTSSGFGSTATGSLGGSSYTPVNTFGSNTGFKGTSQTNFVDSDAFQSGSSSNGVFRPGAIGSALKPGLPYLPPDVTNSPSNVITSTVFPSSTIPTIPRPTFTTPRPTIRPTTSAPAYLPPQIGQPTNTKEIRVPRPTYGGGQIILDENRLPSPKPTPGITISTIPVGCAAALKCTAIEYCTADGVISTSPVILNQDQQSYRVPLTDCKTPETGAIGKCCRDPNYTDPWPTNQLGKWVEGVFGGNDGKYVPDQGRPQTSPRPDTGFINLNTYRTPSTSGSNQVTPRYPSSTGSPNTYQKGTFGQGQFTQKGQGQYEQGSKVQFGQGSQGQFGFGGQSSSTLAPTRTQVTQGQGQFGVKGQGQFGVQGQGQFGVQSQGQFGKQGQFGGQLDVQQEGSQSQFTQVQKGIQGQGQIIKKGEGQIITQGQGYGVNKGTGQTVITGQGTGIRQGQGFGVAQGQGVSGVGQVVTQGQGVGLSQGQGIGVTQGQGFGVSKGQGQITTQGFGQFGTQGQGQVISQGQGIGITQGQGFGIKQGQGSTAIRGQGVVGQGQIVSQGQGIGVSQGQGFGVSKGEGQIISQGQGFGIAQGQGVGVGVTRAPGFGITQGGGQSVSQGIGFGVSQSKGQGVITGQGQIVSQGQGVGFNQGQGFGVKQGQGQLVSQGQGVGVSQGQGFGVSQGQGFGVSQGQGFGLSQGQGFGVSQGQGFGVQGSQGLLTTQGFGAKLQQEKGSIVTQGKQTEIENDFGESVQRVFLKEYNPSSQCGQLNNQVPYGNRGDQEADFAEIPWQAMILLQTNRSLLCGGVITRPDVVITSAACVDGLQAKNVLIKGGEYKLGVDEEPLPFQIVQVKHILRHPYYKAGSLHYDAAILVLEEDLKFAKNIYPICLPGFKETLESFYEGRGECVVTGWGKVVLQAHLAGAIMHTMNVSLIRPSECQAKITQDYPHLLEQYDEESCVCGEPKNPLDNICRVDIGSALACTTGDGHFVMRGIYSWDSGCQPGNQLVGFYKFDMEWYEWAIGLIESIRFSKFGVGTKVTQNKITTTLTSGVKGVQFGGVKGSTGSKGFSEIGQFGQDHVRLIPNIGEFNPGQVSGQFGQFGQFTSGKYTEKTSGEIEPIDLQGNPLSNTFSATYSEKKVYQSEPKIISYTTKPEIVTFTTKPEIVTFTTKPEYFTFTTKPKIVTYTTKPEIFTYTTKPKIVTYTTKPEIVTYTTKPKLISYVGSATNEHPSYAVPAVSFNPSFTDIVGKKHEHSVHCKCLDGKK